MAQRFGKYNMNADEHTRRILNGAYRTLEEIHNICHENLDDDSETEVFRTIYNKCSSTLEFIDKSGAK